jgi:hypothetical protein
MTEIISFTLKRELFQQIESLRGEIPRSRFISRLLEKAIGKGVQ